MAKIVEGLWDCQYCDTKGISGRIRVCPHCAKPRNEDTTFYMGTAKEYISNEEAQQLNKNPDWICSYCNSLNSDNDTNCKSCGASREESEKNYLQNKRRKEQEELEKKRREAQQRAEEERAARRSSPMRFVLLAAIAALLLLTIFGMMPKKTAVTLISKAWQRQVAVEEYKTFTENSWTPPSDAYNVRTDQQIHHYDQVLDHYENRERKVAEQVLDGYETVVTGYNDLGNGYFEEVTEQVPTYHTEYRTEYYQEPVYVSVPVYATMYYYDVDRWVYVRTEETRGTDEEPYFADRAILRQGERFGSTKEQYAVTVRDKKGNDKTYAVSGTMWDHMNKGSTYTITVDGNTIVEFE